MPKDEELDNSADVEMAMHRIKESRYCSDAVPREETICYLEAILFEVQQEIDDLKEEMEGDERRT